LRPPPPPPPTAQTGVALPLSAVHIGRDEPTSALLLVSLTRALAPPDGCGAGGRATHVLGFGEPWRCSVAKVRICIYVCIYICMYI